jgi:hypothetical protein
MCADSTNSHPPPKANPFTAAMLGFGKDSTRRVIWWPGRMKCATLPPDLAPGEAEYLLRRRRH